MKLLSADQIRILEKETMQSEGISSFELIDRAGQSFVNWFLEVYVPEDGNVHIFVGPGNNGADGLVIAGLLSKRFFNVHLYICHLSKNFSEDFNEHFKQLPQNEAINIVELKTGNDYPYLGEPGIIIDALLGIGISRDLNEYWSGLIAQLNADLSERIAVDIPSGMYPDQASEGSIFMADCTFTFEIPKLAFFLPSNIPLVGKLIFGHIGLSHQSLMALSSGKYVVSNHLVDSLLVQRPETGHKGTFGHALLVMGSYGKIGAAILAAKACLRSGTGLVTVHLPKVGYSIMQMAFPEAMVSVDPHEFNLSSFPDVEKYQAIGIGPGIDTNQITKEALYSFLKDCKKPLLLDADALNLISLDSEAINLVPKGSLLTPHPGEFKRLFGEYTNDFERYARLQEVAQELQLFILLKGARSCFASPNGQLFFNTTGNSGMATAGSGDVLSGIITGLVAQGYDMQEAGIIGMYIHGLAGDFAAQDAQSPEAMIASDIIENLGEAFRFFNGEEE